MLNSALNVIQELEKRGFKAYIVGGFVRDYLLGIKTSDIDICTNAKPKEILNIFDNTLLSKEDYGSVTITYKKNVFQITTFRKEFNYLDYRHPDEIIYIDNLEGDLERRDFTINTICIDKNGKTIDILGGIKDLDKRIIKNKELLKKISYDRKRQELDKIFLLPNAKKGIDLLVKLEIDRELEINNLSDVIVIDSLIGMWSLLDIPQNTYSFTNNEKQLIKDIRKAIKIDNLDSYNLYKYGLYVNSIAGVIKGISRSQITNKYEQLIIHSRKDIDITSYDIMNNLCIEPGPKINKIYQKLEKEILNGTIKNEKNDIIKYCVENFSSDI